MKVGILTQFYRKNYGGILQSYALFQVVSNLGFDVEILDFRYNTKTNRTIGQKINGLLKKHLPRKKKIKPKIETRGLPKEHVEAFASFKQKFLKYSPVAENETIKNLVANYDAIIVGSDQVWNDIEGKHLYYFFDFGKPYKGKKISYAPCSIITDIPRKTKRRLGKQFKKMDNISARDKTTQQLVITTSGIKPEIVLDPTFLYEFKEFSSPAIVNGDYVFAYILGSEIEMGHEAVLKEIFKKYGKMKVVAAIIPNISLEVEKFADEVRYNAAPNEWVNLIANSKFVYTDSFHGCVFAMKFHKPFFAYCKDAKRTSRLVDLKNTYGFKNIHAPKETITIAEIEYDKVDDTLKTQKENSLRYIKESLSF